MLYENMKVLAHKVSALDQKSSNIQHFITTVIRGERVFEPDAAKKEAIADRLKNDFALPLQQAYQACVEVFTSTGVIE